MYSTLTSALAAEHRSDLRHGGYLARLGAVAACCHPTRLRQAGTAVAARLRGGRADCCTA